MPRKHSMFNCGHVALVLSVFPLALTTAIHSTHVWYVRVVSFLSCSVFEGSIILSCSVSFFSFSLIELPPASCADDGSTRNKKKSAA